MSEIPGPPEHIGRIEPKRPDNDETPLAVWSEMGDGSKSLSVRLAHGGFIDNTLADPEPDGRRFLHCGYLFVDEDYKRQGLAEKLFKSTIAAAKEQGATNCDSFILSKEAMALHVKVLGDQMNFYDIDKGQVYDLPLAGEQPYASLERAEEYEFGAPPVDREHGIHITIDLTKIDTSDWPLPEIAEPS